jgi:CAAX prenyl protease-like protein
MTPIFARSLPFALYILVLVLEGSVSNWAPGFDARWLYPVKTGLVAVALLILWRHYTELKCERLSRRHILLSIIAGLIVLVLWVNLDVPWMLLGDPGKGYIPLDAQGRMEPWLIAFRITGAALVVPLMEELFWRSFIQRWIQRPEFMTLDPAQIGMRALVIASVLFAVEHQQWLAGLVAGLAYGGLYIYTRNLWAPVIAHAITNGGLGIYVVMTGRWQFW